ncbi:uncharacterized protein LOC131648576 [Vicia villosa]|uniref:uncharacterized protein LOC131648576 n=1 Tax=Vicia villosa TaxID=3911 RepID=UPI00273AB17D|nr:uncharacterized protein LOC131648576 [Vicia villosa]
MRLIRELFDFSGAEAITYVPLVEDVVVDRLVWREEKDGHYSVRSGYRIWKSSKKPPSQENIEVNWNGLWSIIAPPRAKHLLWRICSGCLPSRVRLRQHHVPCPIMCQFCGEEEEDDWHVFFGCLETIECWRTAGLHDTIAPFLHHCNDIRSLILNLCNREDRKAAGRFVMMIELLWHNRNDFIWNNEKEEVSRLGTTNRGWCIRDNLGNFVKASVAWDVGSFYILEAEALALKEAIQSALTLHIDIVIFEGDSLQVVQAIHSNTIGGSEFTFIIRSIKSLLCNFTNFEVKFIKRQANMVVHCLTKAANSWPRRSHVNSIPRCIDSILMNERS